MLLLLIRTLLSSAALRGCLGVASQSSQGLVPVHTPGSAKVQTARAGTDTHMRAACRAPAGLSGAPIGSADSRVVVSASG